MTGGGGAHELLLGGATLADGRRVDVRLAGDRIAAVAPAAGPAQDRSDDPAHEQARQPPGLLRPQRLDLDGYLLLPAPAEPHAHLDKALTGADVPNATGDLPGAVEAWLRHRPTMVTAEIAERAGRAATAHLAHGATAIRSHTDVGDRLGLRAWEALVGVRHALADQLSLQLVAFPDMPLTGAAGAEHRATLRAALGAGADVLGACPYRDPDPAGCHELCLELAEEYAVPVDLHTDETLDPAVQNLEHLSAAVKRREFRRGVTASHCVSLGAVADLVAARVAAAAAAAGVAVVCLPRTNLYLQARDRPGGQPRGLTALRALLRAGVTVAGGGDNMQDPFCTLGRGDPLETASLLVLAGHLTPEEAYTAVSAGARAVMGLPEVRVEPGAPAELLAIRAGSLAEALAVASEERVVIHAGRVVSRTEVRRTFTASAGAPTNACVDPSGARRPRMFGRGGVGRGGGGAGR